MLLEPRLEVLALFFQHIVEEFAVLVNRANTSTSGSIRNNVQRGLWRRGGCGLEQGRRKLIEFGLTVSRRVLALSVL